MHGGQEAVHGYGGLYCGTLVPCLDPVQALWLGRSRPSGVMVLGGASLYML